MIYKNIDTIPYKLFVKIAETGDVSLLSDTNEDPELLIETWNKIYDEHLSKNQTKESRQIFKVSKNIDELLTTNKVVLTACECLKFQFNQELFDLIIGLGYKLSVADTDSYFADIKRIEREANAYVIKATNYKNMLPEAKEQSNNKYNIDDTMALYCTILGFNIGDFNTITYSAFFSYGKQVDAKIEIMKKQNK